MTDKFTVGDKVICVRVPDNFRQETIVEIGEVYTVWAITAKVRMTPGTGDEFLNCKDSDGNKVAFNFADVIPQSKRRVKSCQNLNN